MNLSLRAATVLLPLLLHDAQSAAEQISGRHLRHNDKRSSSSLGLQESDKTMSGNEDDLHRHLMEGMNHTVDDKFQPLSCNANVNVDTCLGPDAVPFSTIVAAADHTPVNAIVQGVAMATQSSTCWGRPASDAINGDHGDFSHTCENSDSPGWWMVDFGDGNDNTTVGEVGIVNRQSGWKYRMVGANVEVLDADMSVVASKVVADEKDIYYFNFAGAVGRYLRIIQRSNNEPLNIAEVKVTKAPTLATGQTPYEHRYIKPGSDQTSEYVTGEAHIPCGVCAIVDYENGDTEEIPRGINVEGMLYFPPTANVELRTPHLYVQGILKIDAPNDGNKIKVHMIDTGHEQFMIPHVENANQCSAVGCSFGEKAVGIAGGTLDIQALPDPSCPTWTFLEAVLDEEEGTNQVLQVGSKAAECWGRRLGDEILITDTIGWKSYANLIGTIASVNIEAGTVTLSSPPTTHTESNDFGDVNGQETAGWISTLANDPDFPAEVAWLSRSVTFDADTKRGNAGGTGQQCNQKQRRIGGHMMISHTSVAQRIEGVEFKNFGQSGTLGKYPIHFHLCDDVSGSTVRKNLVRSSHQRCVVIHRSNNVNIEENVAFGHKGHCFMTEDRVETGNVFKGNLGADGQGLSCVEGILGNKGDNQASTYWISNQKNQFIDNVAAGSINGFWIDGGKDPIEMFSGNIAHSNVNEGIKLYQGHYRPNTPSLFVNTKSFRNKRQGVRLHLNKNLIFKGLLLADNGIAVSSFDNNNESVFEDMTVIGLTAKAREFSVSLNPPISSGLNKETGHHSISGVKFASDPSHTQLSLQNVSFNGFEPHFDGTTEYDILALRLWGAFPGMHGAGGTILHGNDKRFWNMPSLEGVTISSTVNGFDFERQLLIDQPEKMHGYFQDVNGTFHVDGPGVFIPQDSSGVVPNAPEFSFLADHRCSKANSRPDSLALFCAGSCIRKVFVQSNCPGDLLVTSTSTNEQSTFPPTHFRSVTAGWGDGHDETVWTTKLHVAFLPNDEYQLSCKNESGDIFNPKFMRVTFDGKTYQILNNNNCCGPGWYNMHWDRPPPLCSPYVGQGSFQLPELPLYQRFEANEFVHHWNAAQVDSIKLKQSNFGGARYGPVNFGAPGESRAVLINWKSLTSWVRVEMKLDDDDGTLIGSVGQSDAGIVSAMEIDIPPEVSGIHEVIFTAHRFAGTHHFAEIFSFEILPPHPTTSPTMSYAPTSSIVPTITPPLTVELACGSGASACAGRRQSAELDELHPLRCCADKDLGEDWERRYPKRCPEGVFGASDFGGTCHKAVTFSEGKSICESEGGRLCTIREVLSNCPRGTGCGLDEEMVWTSTSTESVMNIVFTPNDNSKWFQIGSTLEDTGELVFSVNATNDAHVALGSAEDQPTGRDVPNHVEIFIGGWGNSRSGIRPATGDVNNQFEVSGAYLSGSDYNTFRITWSPTEIKLEHLSLCDRWVTMVSMDRSSLGIIIDRAIVMTGWGSMGEFQLVESPSPSCEVGTVLTPNDNSKWFPIGSTLEDTGELAFSVKATNDAHVALGSAEDQPTGRDVPNHVEIFIGGWGNSRSGIRPATGDVNNQFEVSGAYLSGSDYNTFRITWSPTEIKLEHLAGCDRWVTMVSMDRSSLGIIIDRAIVMTGWGSMGEFQLVEGLPLSCEVGTVLTPNDNSKWFPIGSTLEDTGELAFSVKATNDAHVALGSAEDQPTGRDVPNHVEIFIGGWGNSRSGIRPATGDVNNQFEVSGAYLRGSDYNTFRITWSPTEIKLEHLSLCDRWVTMVSMDRSSLGIIIDRAIVMTGWGSMGEFQLVESPSPSCEVGTVLTPNDNSKWFPIGSTLEDTGELAFSVKATNDAHVALGSAEDQPTGRHVPNHVEIFIGGWGNSRSGIRPATGDVNNQFEVSGAYLRGSDYNTFRITWSPTEIKLEHLAGCDWVTMVSMDRSSLGIIIDRAIVMTGWGSMGEFQLVEGLPLSCEA